MKSHSFIFRNGMIYTNTEGHIREYSCLTLYSGKISSKCRCEEEFPLIFRRFLQQNRKIKSQIASLQLLSTTCFQNYSEIVTKIRSYSVFLLQLSCP